MPRSLAEGQHRNTTGVLEYFTTAFLHRLEDLAREVGEAGFVVNGVLGVEGPVWLARDFDERWADPRRRAQLPEFARRVERNPDLLGVSQHLLAVAHHP